MGFCDRCAVEGTISSLCLNRLGGCYNIPVRDHIQTLLFTLHFIQGKASSDLIAIYSHAPNQPTPTVKDIVNAFSPRVAGYIPQGLTVDLRDMIFAYDKMEEVTQYLFGVDMAVSIDLSDLPLIGSRLPLEERVGVNPLQIITTSRDILQEQVSAFNALVPSGVNKLPDRTLQHGFNIAAVLHLGSLSQPLTLPVTDPSTTAPPAQPQPPTSTSAVTNDNTLWYKVQRSFGPIHLERIGLQYQHPSDEPAAIAFLLDASLSAAGLTLSLDGLSVGSPLTKFEPKFNLNGIGIDYRGSSALEIGGALLKVTDNEYDGTAIIKTEELTLCAIGSYTELKGHPSLFIYAILDYPLGGPPFFFVTGLSAGFGYNRALRISPIETVAQFPLVEEAVQGTGQTGDLEAELRKLNQYIAPATGENFLAVGIKFTSFKMIDSFALLTVSFGNRFELDILGLSTLVVPTPEEGKSVTPLAEVQMALKATFIPDEGFLGVRAQLTSNSYILSKNCHLTGGFAFYTWFSGKHADDFVQTLGGYHPNFKVPTHYPSVPRLGFNWQVDGSINIKGDAYYALCSHALMAGGHLQAVYQSGNLSASFNAGADFLISWKPYHYEAEIYVEIRASYTYWLWLFGTCTIDVDVSANLSIWGPEFGGTATLHILCFYPQMSFGSSSSQQPQPIDWSTFRASFLPKDEEICSVAVKDGLVRKVGNDKSDFGVINPKHFCLVTNSVIPSKEAYQKEASPSSKKIELGEANTTFGIGSMAVNSSDLTTKHIITITRNKANVEDEFQYIPILKNVPAGLWGESLTPDLNGTKFITNALSGFEIRPGTEPKTGSTDSIERQKLLYNIDPDSAKYYTWETLTKFNTSQSNDEERRNRIHETIVKKPARDNLLQALGFNPSKDLSISDSIASEFLMAPQIEEVSIHS